MISVIVEKTEGRWHSLHSIGHAGYAQAGEDIVCAAVSALLINACNSLEAFTDDTFEGEEADGKLELTFPDGLSEKGSLLMDSLLLGLQQIEEEYGSEFLSVIITEVL